jgi:HEAT repeat protein
MNNHTDALIQTLKKLSPMPSDDSPQLTEERLRNYAEVIAQIDEIVRSSEAGRDTRFIKPLIRSFGYGDAYEGYWPVIHILEKYPSDILHPALCEAIETGEPGAQMWCAYMLGRHRKFEDVPVLVAALNNPKSKVRYNALKALAMIGDSAAKQAMEALLDDPVEQVRKKAKECIEALVDQRWVIRQQ